MTDRTGKLILSDEVVDNNNGPESKNMPSFADLPSCLLGVIMSCLLLRDNIRASAVCKAWREAAEYVRVVEKCPWILSIPQHGNLVDLFDPLQRKMYTLNLPEIAGTTVLYSKDGWLLMYIPNRVGLFFLNPYTREVISLPKCELVLHQAIGFSSAPTTGTCTLLALNFFRRSRLEISICYPGATEWVTKEFPFPLDFDHCTHSNLVYANDHFYCFAWGGVLFDIDPASHTLSYQAWEEHKNPYNPNFEWPYQRKRIYLMEQKGALFLMYTSGSLTPMVYKLVSSRWEEVSSATLDGVTIFASLYSSETRMDISGMRNRVYFPKYGLRNMECESYSFDDGMYHPRDFPKTVTRALVRDAVRNLSIENLWIEPPPCKDDVIYFKRSKGKEKGKQREDKGKAKGKQSEDKGKAKGRQSEDKGKAKVT